MAIMRIFLALVPATLAQFIGWPPPSCRGAKVSCQPQSCRGAPGGQWNFCNFEPGRLPSVLPPNAQGQCEVCPATEAACRDSGLNAEGMADCLNCCYGKDVDYPDPTCVDDPFWLYDAGDKGDQGCLNVAGKPSARCDEHGYDGRFATQACPRACGICCEDDLSWHAVINGVDRGCDFIEDASQFCNEKNAAGVKAKDACRSACKTCPKTQPSKDEIEDYCETVKKDDCKNGEKCCRWKNGECSAESDISECTYDDISLRPSPRPRPTPRPVREPSYRPTMRPYYQPSPRPTPRPIMTPKPSPKPLLSTPRPSPKPVTIPRFEATDATLPKAVATFLEDPKVSEQIYGPIELWDTRRVTTMRDLFNADRDRAAGTFNADISKWDTSNVLDFEGMFTGAATFNAPIGKWNTARATNMRMMFWRASSFNRPLGGWDTGNVVKFYNMFNGCASFNQNLNSWDVASAEDMMQMFANCPRYDQPMNRWDVREVNSMNGMFLNAGDFNQFIGNWNIEGLRSMSMIFRDAADFDQDLGWCLDDVVDQFMPFDGSGCEDSACGTVTGANCFGIAIKMDASVEEAEAASKLSLAGFAAVLAAVGLVAASLYKKKLRVAANSKDAEQQEPLLDTAARGRSYATL